TNNDKTNNDKTNNDKTHNDNTHNDKTHNDNNIIKVDENNSSAGCNSFSSILLKFMKYKNDSNNNTKINDPCHMKKNMNVEINKDLDYMKSEASMPNQMNIMNSINNNVTGVDHMNDMSTLNYYKKNNDPSIRICNQFNNENKKIYPKKNIPLNKDEFLKDIKNVNYNMSDMNIAIDTINNMKNNMMLNHVIKNNDIKNKMNNNVIGDDNNNNNNNNNNVFNSLHSQNMNDMQS
ncbi:putative eukaryotic translation initiation factor subunit eIF2A, partial [Plasmodium gaboni]